MILGVKVQHSTVKVTGQGSYMSAQICFQMITSVWINQMYSKFTYVSHSGKNPVDLRVKGEGENSFEICFWMLTPVKINELVSNFTLLSPITQE